jgi:hypothetical protein
LAVDVPVTVSLTCDEGFDFGVVDVFLSQARGTSAAFGSAESGPVACTGETQNLTVRVFGGVFHGGQALAGATVLQCQGVSPNAVCEFTDIRTSQEIKIRGA